MYMGKESVLDTMKGLLSIFVNTKTIATISDIAQFTGRDRIAMVKYIEFFCDLMILNKR